MLTFITVVHVFLCVFMIFVILLQPGKDAGMGAALGGGAATSAFGGRGAVTFLSKVTGVCAALFFLTSLGLSFVGLKPSVVDEEEPPPAAAAPAAASEAAKATGAEGIEQGGQTTSAAPAAAAPAPPTDTDISSATPAAAPAAPPPAPEGQQ
jgi:preprotein translocase subunit SecG